MKHFLVIYEKPWIKNELTSDRKLKQRLGKHCAFTYQQQDLRRAPMITKNGKSNLDGNWLRQNVTTNATTAKYDGVAILFNGKRLQGRHGVHFKKTYQGKQFSLIEMNCQQGWYRQWEQRPNRLWFLAMTRRREAPYKQVTYTFEHEIGHALAWLHNIHDSLHTFVNIKMYEDWWRMIVHILNRPPHKR